MPNWGAVLVCCAFASVSCKGKNTERQPPSPERSASAPVAPALTPGQGAQADRVAARPAPPPIVPPPTRRVYVTAIRDEAEFMAYSKQLAGERFTRFVIDVKTRTTYFFDVNTYELHKDFIFAELYRTKLTKAADRKFRANYGRKKTEFILGYLVHHLGPDQWTMAFWSGDLIQPRDVEFAFAQVTGAFYLGKRVKYRPDSHLQEWSARTLRGVPVITNDKLYKDAQYQAFNTGKAIGVLRIVAANADVDQLTFDRTEIVVLPVSLPDITPVAGIISNTFSTPLSHVSLRARAWGIPNIGFKRATERYAALNGKTVYFEADAVKHTLREATATEIAAWKRRRAAARRIAVPAADLKMRELRPLAKLRARDVAAYGAKAANLGQIVAGKPAKVAVPDGFGIPIVYYHEHLKTSGLDVRVNKLLGDARFRRDAGYRKQELAKLRGAIIKAPVARDFRAELTARVTALAGDKGVFVRSSTNAEDLPGFNGAGLYDTVPNVKGEARLLAAVKQVWASVWNLRAYEEREFFGIDHTKVYGAVLIQLAVNPTAAGVLITPPPNAPPLRQIYVINAKSGLGMRVVSGKKSPEIVHYNHYNRALRILSRSDETTQLIFEPGGGIKEVPIEHRGRPVLTDPRARKLGAAAHSIVQLFPKDRALDIEWLFVGDELYIVQARPYVSGR